MTRLAILGDTHLPRGRRAIPPAAWHRIRAADLVVHTGDLVAPEVLDALEAAAPGRVRAVHGNADRPAVRERLPERLELDLGGGLVLGVVHDAGPKAGRLARLRRAFPGCAAVVFGHSHIPLHEEADAFAIFNPGSATDRRREPTHTMGEGLVQDGVLRLAHVDLGPDVRAPTA